jgi:hypothetical protein
MDMSDGSGYDSIAAVAMGRVMHCVHVTYSPQHGEYHVDCDSLHMYE